MEKKRIESSRSTGSRPNQLKVCVLASLTLILMLLAFGGARCPSDMIPSRHMTETHDLIRPNSIVQEMPRDAYTYPLTLCGDTSGLELLASISQPESRVGVDVVVVAALRNCGTTPIAVPKTMWLPGQHLKLRVERDGQPVRFRGLVAKPLPLEFSCQFILLHPHETYGVALSLTVGASAFDLSKPGHYRVRTEFAVPKAHGQLASKLVAKDCHSWEVIIGWEGVCTAEPIDFSIR